MADGHSTSSRVVERVGWFVRLARPWQWYKQSVLLLGIVFSRQMLEPSAWPPVLVGIVSFCAVTSGMYVLNDVRDRERDRNHPQKRYRPVASGAVSVPVAVGYALVLLVGGFALAWSVGPTFSASAVAYVLVTVAYTLGLKRYVHLDVITIAIGFVIRAVAGVLAVEAAISPWLVVCTFLVALMLALGKRRRELDVSDPGMVRSVNEAYTETEVEQLLLIVISTLLLSYSLYTFFGTRDELVVTLPFAYYAVFRYHRFVHVERLDGSVQRLLTDRLFLANGLCWGLVTLTVLYRIPEKVGFAS